MHEIEQFTVQLTSDIRISWNHIYQSRHKALETLSISSLSSTNTLITKFNKQEKVKNLWTSLKIYHCITCRRYTTINLWSRYMQKQSLICSIKIKQGRYIVSYPCFSFCIFQSVRWQVTCVFRTLNWADQKPKRRAGVSRMKLPCLSSFVFHLKMNKQRTHTHKLCNRFSNVSNYCCHKSHQSNYVSMF